MSYVIVFLAGQLFGQFLAYQHATKRLKELLEELS